MNGILAIELAHQHQQALLDHAGRSRLATRRHRTHRSALTGWWRNRWLGVLRHRAADGASGGGSALVGGITRACSPPPTS